MSRELPIATQFNWTRTGSGKKAFEAWSAIWVDKGKQIAICAPTLIDLEMSWFNITGKELIGDKAQHVWITEAK